jgi:hypothetical protein
MEISDKQLDQLDKDIEYMKQLVAQFDLPHLDRVTIMGDRETSLAFEHLQHIESLFMVHPKMEQKPWIETDATHGYLILWLLHRPDLEDRSVYQAKLDQMIKRRDILEARGEHIYFDNGIQDFSSLASESEHLCEVIKKEFRRAEFTAPGVLEGVPLYHLNRIMKEGLEQFEPVLKKLKRVP